MSVEFGVLNALRDLDQATPAFFVGELFRHGDLTVRNHAIKVLNSLDPRNKNAYVLRTMLKATECDG